MREPADKSKLYYLINNLENENDFDEENYSLKLSLPSYKEFSNVFNEKSNVFNRKEYMSHHEYYPIVIIKFSIFLG